MQLGGCVSAVAASTRAAAEARGLRLRVEMDDALRELWVQADATRVSQVCCNSISTFGNSRAVAYPARPREELPTEQPAERSWAASGRPGVLAPLIGQILTL